jgi:hypothetical protein
LDAGAGWEAPGCDLGVVRGDDWQIRFDVEDPGGEPADLSGVAAAVFTVGSGRAGPAVSVACQVGPEAGRVWALVAHAETDLEPRPYPADLELTYQTGQRQTVWLGQVVVVDDVTKHPEEEEP